MVLKDSLELYYLQEMKISPLIFRTKVLFILIDTEDDCAMFIELSKNIWPHIICVSNDVLCRQI